MPHKLKIATITAEIAPFAKTGGLADVTRSLSKSLYRLGHDVIVVMPLYGLLIDKEKNNLKLLKADIILNLNSKEKVKVNYWVGELMPGLKVYFVENKKYFSKRKTLYGSQHENARFLVFDVAALKLLSLLKFEADIIHCHDWQTGLIPQYLKGKFKNSKTLKQAKTIFTIHNLVFQLGKNWWEISSEDKDYGRKRLPMISDPAIENINFSKRAILSADIINTVSEQYRDEILTKKFGQDLERVLKNREDYLFGIVNGIDYKAYNPDQDPGLYKKYSHKKIYRKKLNKEFIQDKFNLQVDTNVPLFCATSRVTFQKGFDLIGSILDDIARLDMQLIVMGDGDKNYISKLKKAHKKYPQKIIWLPFSQKLETLLYAASDMFLLPSNHEPCGINQLIAMRYGCVPVVRKVGGLHNTVDDFNPSTDKGTGFVFKTFSGISLYGSIIRSLENYKYKEVWRDIAVRCMQQSNSWEIPAKKYLALYKKAIKINTNK